MSRIKKDLLSLILIFLMAAALSLGILAIQIRADRQGEAQRISSAFDRTANVLLEAEDRRAELDDQYRIAQRNRGAMLSLALSEDTLKILTGKVEEDPENGNTPERLRNCLTTGENLLLLDGDGRTVVELGPTEEDPLPDVLREKIDAMLAENALPEDGGLTDIGTDNLEGYFLYCSTVTCGKDDYRMLYTQDMRNYMQVSLSQNIITLGLNNKDKAYYMLCFENDDGVCWLSEDGSGNKREGTLWNELGLSESALKDGWRGLQELPEGRRKVRVRFVGRDSVLVLVETGENNYNLGFVLRSFVLMLFSALFTGLYGSFARRERTPQEQEASAARDLLHGRTPQGDSLPRRVIPFAAFCLVLSTGLTFYMNTLSDITTAMRTSEPRLDQLTENLYFRNLSTDYETGLTLDGYVAVVRMAAKILESNMDTVMRANDAENMRAYHYRDADTGVVAEKTNWFGQAKTARVRNTILGDFADLVVGNRHSEDGGHTFRKEQEQIPVVATLWDLDGSVIVTSGSEWAENLYDMPEATGKPLLDVLNRARDSYITTPRDTVYGSDMMVAVPVNLSVSMRENGKLHWSYAGDKNNLARGITIQAMLTVRLGGYMKSLPSWAGRVGDLLKSLEDVDHCAYILQTDSTDDPQVLYADGAEREKGLANMQLSEEKLKNDYVGLCSVNGDTQFVSIRHLKLTGNETGSYSSGTRPMVLAAIYPSRQLYAERLMDTLIYLGACLLLMLVACLLICLMGRKKAAAGSVPKAPETDDAGFRFRFRFMPAGYMENWRRKAAENKMRTIFRVCVVLVLLLIPVMYIHDTNAEAPSVLRYIVEMRWDRGVNIFTVTTILSLGCAASLLTRVIGALMKLIYSTANSRVETCCRMIGSFLHAALFAGMVIFSLYILGVDTTSMLASVGLLSAALAFGSRKVVEDIVAGIFLILEGDFKVGDIINIGNFTGRVMDIGIRTTKVIDRAGDVKILNNSGISGVINKSSETSMAILDMKMSPDAPVAEVEKIILEALPEIERKYPEIIGPIHYIGIREATAKYNMFRLEAECPEEKRGVLQTALDRELLDRTSAAGFRRGG